MYLTWALLTQRNYPFSHASGSDPHSKFAGFKCRIFSHASRSIPYMQDHIRKYMAFPTCVGVYLQKFYTKLFIQTFSHGSGSRPGGDKKKAVYEYSFPREWEYAYQATDFVKIYILFPRKWKCPFSAFLSCAKPFLLPHICGG